MVIRDRYLLRQSDEFYLESGQEASVNLALEKAPPLPCTKLCGQVVSGCRAIRGATVKIFDKCRKPIYHTETDDEGSFSFINTLIPGDYEMIAAADDYLVSESRFISLRASAPMYVTIQLCPDENAKRSTVYGTIRDEKNAPLPGVQVFIFDSSDTTFPKAFTVSNSDGEYLVCGLDPGSYMLSAYLNGFLFPEWIFLSLYPNEIACADLYLYKDASALKGTISGRVVYNGAAAAYAVTALYRLENNAYSLIQIRKANSRGLYLFSGLRAGKYVVRAKLSAKSAALCGSYVIE